MPRKCTAPKINIKIHQKIDIQDGDIEKGDMVEYLKPTNVFWRGIEKVHRIKKNKIVMINVVDERTHITFRHVRAIYKPTPGGSMKYKGLEWEKFK